MQGAVKCEWTPGGRPSEVRAAAEERLRLYREQQAKMRTAMAGTLGSAVINGQTVMTSDTSYQGFKYVVYNPMTMDTFDDDDEMPILKVLKPKKGK